jgi:hypothetical protein
VWGGEGSPQIKKKWAADVAVRMGVDRVLLALGTSSGIGPLRGKSFWSPQWQRCCYMPVKPR